MTTSTFVKNFRDGTLVLSDATAMTALSVTANLDQGDFSISGLAADLKEVVTYESRGELVTVRHSNRTYPTGSFSCHMAEFTDADPGTVADAILKTGTTWAAAVSTLGADQEVYTLDIQLTVEGTDFGDSKDSVIALTDCHCTIDFAEGDPNTFTINFTCYGDVTMT